MTMDVIKPILCFDYHYSSHVLSWCRYYYCARPASGEDSYSVKFQTGGIYTIVLGNTDNEKVYTLMNGNHDFGKEPTMLNGLI